MDGGALQERLRRAREACGEDLGTLSRRTGVRVQQLRAIENGRFDELPPGIYARSAVRAFAEACGLDAADVLATCDALLPRVADPIGALARKCGLHPSASEDAEKPAVATASDKRRERLGEFEGRSPSIEGARALAGAAVDAVVVGALLMTVVVVVAAAVDTPIAAFGGSPVPLAFMGLLLAAGYFVWFGGLVGATLGRVAAGASSHVDERERLTLRVIGQRALASATCDARAIVMLGRLLTGRVMAVARPARSARPTERELSPLRWLDLAQGPWSPASPPDVAPPQPLHQPRG